MPANEAQIKANLTYREKNREKCLEYSREYNNKYRTEYREEYNAKQRICALNYYNRTKDKHAENDPLLSVLPLKLLFVYFSGIFFQTV